MSLNISYPIENIQTSRTVQCGLLRRARGQRPVPFQWKFASFENTENFTAMIYLNIVERY